eukprot:8527710-Pyramimonas_sp.AAC.1
MVSVDGARKRSGVTMLAQRATTRGALRAWQARQLRASYLQARGINAHGIRLTKLGNVPEARRAFSGFLLWDGGTYKAKAEGRVRKPAMRVTEQITSTGKGRPAKITCPIRGEQCKLTSATDQCYDSLMDRYPSWIENTFSLPRKASSRGRCAYVWDNLDTYVSSFNKGRLRFRPRGLF